MTGLLQRVTVVRVREAADDPDNLDAHGMPVKGAPVELPVPGCSVQPGAAPEVLGNRQTTEVAWTVYATGHPDIVSTDRIRLPGDTHLYNIDGEPLRWPAGLTLGPQTVLVLQRWQEGS